MKQTENRDWWNECIQIDHTTIHIGSKVQLNKEKVIENKGQWFREYEKIDPLEVRCIQVRFIDFENKFLVSYLVGTDEKGYWFTEEELELVQ